MLAGNEVNFFIGLGFDVDHASIGGVEGNDSMA
jgi:hypothetical protein